MQLLRSPDHDLVYLGAVHADGDGEQRADDSAVRLDLVHLFEAPSMLAINAALVAKRPLLVRGEPGVGKSQLAKAAAVALGRRFLSRTLTIRTEIQELFWALDSVRRLAEAQLLSAVTPAEAKIEQVVEAQLRLDKFVEPGPLWWAFNWAGARAQLKRARPKLPDDQLPPPTADQGTVVLLDEIDKADGSVPNGLLEALGHREFPGPAEAPPIRQVGVPPLVVITTNEERVLPNAFLRRCLVLNLSLPETEGDLIATLMERGRAHFKAGLADGRAAPSDRLLTEAAKRLATQRAACLVPPKPGQAEYLDLVRAVCQLASADAERIKMLDQVEPLTLGKYRVPSHGPTESYLTEMP